MKEVKVRDTSSMTALSSVDSNTVISNGAYKISSVGELAKLAEMVNAGKVTGGEFVLAADIDLSIYSSGAGWTPIGSGDNPFQVSFDGNGHTISNLDFSDAYGMIEYESYGFSDILRTPRFPVLLYRAL